MIQIYFLCCIKFGTLFREGFIFMIYHQWLYILWLSTKRVTCNVPFHDKPVHWCIYAIEWKRLGQWYSRYDCKWMYWYILYVTNWPSHSISCNTLGTYLWFMPASDFNAKIHQKILTSQVSQMNGNCWIFQCFPGINYIKTLSKTNAGWLLIEPLRINGINSSDILIKKMYLKMLSGKWFPSLDFL